MMTSAKHPSREPRAPLQSARRAPSSVLRRSALPAGWALVLVCALLLAFPVGAHALTASEAHSRALDYVHAQLRDNGGFATNSPTGDLSITPWAIMAVSAAGYDPHTWQTAQSDIVTVLRTLDLEHEASQGSGSNNAPAFYAKLILAFNAAGRPDLALEAGRPAVNLSERLLSYRHAETGHFSMSATNPGVADISTTIWAILALSALGSHHDVVTAAADWLTAAQGADGGFSFQTGAIEDVDDTGAAIQALLAAGRPTDDPAIQAAVSFLREHQNDDGGFVSWVTDTKSTAESTAWALQALSALGEDLNAWTRQDDPVGYLLSLQQPSGAFAHRGQQLATPLMTTTQVVIALSGKSFPFSLATHAAAPDYRPTLSALSPADDATVPATGFTITGQLADEPGGTGIDPASVKVLFDNTALSLDAAALAQGSLSAQAPSSTPGAHAVRIVLGDRAGHLVTTDLTVNVANPPPTTATTTTTHPSTTTTAHTTGGTQSPTTGRTGPSTGPYTTSRGTSGGGGLSGTSTPPTMAGTSSRTTPSSTGRQTGLSATGSQASAPANGNADMVVGTRMEGVDSAGLPGQEAETQVEVTGAVVADPPRQGGGSWGTGLLAGGIVALMPLGAGVSLMMHRRRNYLLAEAIPAAPQNLSREKAGGVDRAAWASFQERVRYHLAMLPIPDDEPLFTRWSKPW